jgi:hypothetical protein
MQAVAHGNAKLSGLSKPEAAEYVIGQSPKGLPERILEKKTAKRLKKAYGRDSEK